MKHALRDWNVHTENEMCIQGLTHSYRNYKSIFISPDMLYQYFLSETCLWDTRAPCLRNWKNSVWTYINNIRQHMDLWSVHTYIWRYRKQQHFKHLTSWEAEVGGGVFIYFSFYGLLCQLPFCTISALITGCHHDARHKAVVIVC